MSDYYKMSSAEVHTETCRQALQLTMIQFSYDMRYNLN